MTVIICFVGCCITWPVLFPVNATGGGNQAQLDMLSYSNIDKSGNGQYRYFAHALILWVYFGFILFLITFSVLAIARLNALSYGLPPYSVAAVTWTNATSPKSPANSASPSTPWRPTSPLKPPRRS